MYFTTAASLTFMTILPGLTGSAASTCRSGDAAPSPAAVAVIAVRTVRLFIFLLRSLCARARTWIGIAGVTRDMKPRADVAAHSALILAASRGRYMSVWLHKGPMLRSHLDISK